MSMDRCRLFCVATAAYVLLCAGLYAYDDVVPGAQCACAVWPVLVDPECAVDFECRWYPTDDLQAQLGDKQQAMTASAKCRNCDPVNPMSCLQQLCVTMAIAGA